ncbi:hypothetical protein H1235_12715 [Pseudoxanthomonas sp. NC8]|nr:hypothetical protein H1235_12715 [Pseudoxanthomonas sp. NC8]
MGNSEHDDIKARALDSFFLSAGLREALEKGEYDEPINARVDALFQDWDGTVPGLGQAVAGDGKSSTQADSNRDIEVALSLGDDDDFPYASTFARRQSATLANSSCSAGAPAGVFDWQGPRPPRRQTILPPS